MHIKTALRFHLVLVRMTIIRKPNADKDEEKIDCWWKCKLAQATMENSLKLPQKTKK